MRPPAVKRRPPWRNSRNLFDRSGVGEMSLVDDHKSYFAAGEHSAVSIANFRGAKAVSSLLFFLPAFDENFLIDRNGLAIGDGHLRGDGALTGQLGELAHSFIENDGDDATVSKTTTASIIQAQRKFAAGSAIVEIEFERQLHARRIGGAATATAVRGIGTEFS